MGSQRNELQGCPLKQLVELAVFTQDVAGMSSFYENLLPAATKEMAIFRVDGTKRFIHKVYSDESGDLPSEDHIALGVEDVDAVCAQLQAAGMTLEIEAKNDDWGRSAYLGDPEGQLSKSPIRRNTRPSCGMLSTMIHFLPSYSKGGAHVQNPCPSPGFCCANNIG